MTDASPPRIVVAGSANMDLVGLAERLPRPGETVLGDTVTGDNLSKAFDLPLKVSYADGRFTARGA